MPAYVFKGRLCGYICPECPEPLAKVNVRLYRNREGQPVSALAAAAPKDTFAILSDDEVSEKQSSLFAETTTDEQGGFRFELGEEYDGGAFEVDVYCGTVPHAKPPKHEPDPVQFSLTTLHPQWRETEEGLVAGFDYCIPARFWCGIRHRFGAWTICGQVTVCETKEPVSGVRVLAFDRDWLQDDDLGSGMTDAAGKFRIDYSSHDFKKTPFSGLDFEWTGGPDLYFRVEMPDGTPLLVEDPAIGRTAARENVGPCFCAHLCLDRTPPTHPGPLPLFTNVGAYEVNPAAGDFTADGTTTAGGMAFTGTIPLIGILPNGDAPEAEQYRFQVQKLTPAAGPVQDVVAAMVPATPIGKLQYFEFVLGAWTPNSVNYWVNNPGATVSIPQSAGPNLVVPVNTDVGAGGWIDVPRNNELFPGGGGLFKHQELLAYLDTKKLSDQHFDLTGPPPLAAGASVPPASVAQKPTYRISFAARKIPSLAPLGANQLAKIAISNTTYTYVRHPEWAGGTVSGHSVVSLDIAELIAPGATGCDEIVDHLHALFTCYNPYLGSAEVSFEGNPPLPAAINPPVVAGEAASGAAGHDFVTTTLNPCAYIIWLTATALLTSGYGLIGNATITDHIAFCKK